MCQEIDIHRSISHHHIVGFHTHFEDKDYIYIILELCSKRVCSHCLSADRRIQLIMFLPLQSLMEMHKRRKTLTEPEVRHFLRQIAQACLYLHDSNIVHRDLKLGNLFINENMELKVGDFGLATRIKTVGERKLTLCGTPNYIAPEVLLKKGHGLEVDVWSLGCIMYTLLVGKPPFETSDLKDTYRRIRHNDYVIPANIEYDARNLIKTMLHADPTMRPTMREILESSYLTKMYVPSRLPTSCLTMAPRFDQGRLSIMPNDVVSPRRALAQKNYEVPKALVPVKPVEPAKSEIQDTNGLTTLSEQLMKVLKNQKRALNLEDLNDPNDEPMQWISKWVDYTDKYGIGYQLCDNSIGVLFNDFTRIVLMSDENNLQYIHRDGLEEFHFLSSSPPHLNKKITLLCYFKNYMSEHLLKTGEKPNLDDELSRLPYLQHWFRTRNAIVFQLSSGIVQVSRKNLSQTLTCRLHTNTELWEHESNLFILVSHSLQINFFQDHTKLILCPTMGAITYINEARDFRTFKISALEKHGITRELHTRIRYSSEVIERLIAMARGSKATARK